MRDPEPHTYSSVDPSPSATWEERLQFDAASIDCQSLSRLFPEFRLFDCIHHGGFGAVYLGLERKSRKWIAFKVLSKSSTATWNDYKAFQSDLEKTGQLIHPGMVRILVKGERNGIVFLGQEWVDGTDLVTLTHGQDRLEIGAAVEIVCQAAEAVEFAHKNNIYHQELRPSNLMLVVPANQPVTVKVLNFGLSRLAEGEVAGFKLDMSGKFRGTVDYLAPEQIDRPREVDSRSDVYGLGAILYRLLTGKPPHQAKPEDSTYHRILKITQEEIKPVRTWAPEVPEALENAIRRMLSRRMEDRPGSAGEILQALAPYRSKEALERLRLRIAQAKRVLPILQDRSNAHAEPPPVIEKRPELNWKPFVAILLSIVACYLAWKAGLFY